MGAVSSPCHSATTQPCRSHNSPEQDKGGIHPCPTASLLGRHPKGIREEALEEPLELLGGRKTGGWMRLWKVLHCKTSSQQGHLQSPSEGWKSCFSLQEQTPATPEMRITTEPSSKTKAIPSRGALEKDCRAHCPHPLQSQGQQP